MRITDLKCTVLGSNPVIRITTKWWYDIVEGLPDPIVQDGFITVWDTPGMGVELNEEATRQYLPEGDEDFFD